MPPPVYSALAALALVLVLAAVALMAAWALADWLAGEDRVARPETMRCLRCLGEFLPRRADRPEEWLRRNPDLCIACAWRAEERERMLKTLLENQARWAAEGPPPPGYDRCRLCGAVREVADLEPMLPIGCRCWRGCKREVTPPLP